MSTTKRGALGRSYWKLWVATTVSNVGDGIRFAALPLLAASLTRDPLLVAGTIAASQLPWLLLALLSGALVDRFDRRVVMSSANTFRALAMALLAASLLGEFASLPLIYVIVFLLGCAETLFDSASPALVPSLVQEKDLERANGRLETSIIFGQTFVGPPIGAALFALSAASPFIADGVSFAVGAAIVFSIRGDFRPTPEDDEGAAAGLYSQIREGICWVWRHPIIRKVMIVAAISNIVATATLAVRVLFATSILGLDTAGFGLLLAAEGAGAIPGALLAGRVSERLGRGRALLLTLVLMIASNVLFGSTSNAFVAGAALAIEGAGVALWNVVVISLCQSLTPGHLLGRMFSALNTVSWGVIPLGAVLGGLAAREVGLRAPWLLGAGVTAVSLLAIGLRLSREVSRFGEPQEVVV